MRWGKKGRICTSSSFFVSILYDDARIQCVCPSSRIPRLSICTAILCTWCVCVLKCRTQFHWNVHILFDTSTHFTNLFVKCSYRSVPVSWKNLNQITEKITVNIFFSSLAPSCSFWYVRVCVCEHTNNEWYLLRCFLHTKESDTAPAEHIHCMAE